MNTDHLNYAVLLFLSGCIALFYIQLIWRRREAPGVFALMIFMGGAVIWTWTYCLFWLFPNWPKPGFWLDATYLGVVIVPTAMLVFALQLNFLDNWLNNKIIAVLLVEPILTLLLLWTDPYHNLFFGGKRTLTTTNFYDGGFWFWFNIIYIYTLILASLIILIRGFIRAKGIYRQQHGLILVGGLTPVVVNALRFAGVEPFPGVDPTPFFFSIQGLLYTLGIFRFSTFDLIPIARNTLLETMPEGLMVVDNRWRLVEINRAALNLLDKNRSAVIGKNISYVLNNWPELEKIIKRADQSPEYYQVQWNETTFLGVNITPLVDKDDNITGRLVTWRDITQQLQTEKNLEEANQELRNQLFKIQSLQAKLKQRVIRDPLTGLLNRRFFDEALHKEVARAERKGAPITILIVDIDKFKRINDTYGHAAGDCVLEKFGELLRTQTRKADLAVRLGGEEFLILMNGINLEQGMKRAEEIRELIEHTAFDYDDFSIHITVSIGGAEYPSSSKSIKDVMRKADQALYRAKFKGRNQVAR